MQNFDPVQAQADVAALRAEVADLVHQLTALAEEQLTALHTKIIAVENKIAPMLRDFSHEIAGSGTATEIEPIDARQVGTYTDDPQKPQS